MTHYTISYRDLPKNKAQLKALQDIREYLTEKQWNLLGEFACYEKVRYESMRSKVAFLSKLRFLLSMVGVRGYPVGAYVRAAFAVQKRRNEEVIDTARMLRDYLMGEM